MAEPMKYILTLILGMTLFSCSTTEELEPTTTKTTWTLKVVYENGDVDTFEYNKTHTSDTYEAWFLLSEEGCVVYRSHSPLTWENVACDVRRYSIINKTI